ncbi:hypothetical protein CONPUDRAFT_82054 [Coniophora puteana RWD-64-598 SS2]|uniref:Mitochondrial ribosomal protein subunit L20 n=1 Tax=Coniophora puteana (strain RWD-64-598) TaxID=741705 RepID=A0A5M3MPG4_CONPW|nr:uncharacterized protein CONPUDRAFT_82054 [Coniophora puteana RWD-64-598 SS2]EIW80937.1 hypothetical protein CONPUDRAFT_82054 [Coniophora puteana RWD-64-598 SS2]
MLKPRTSFPLRAVRGYVTRIPGKPQSRVPDPLSASSAEVTALEDNLTFVHRPPPSAPTPFSTTLAPASPLLRPASADSNAAVPPLLRPSAYAPAPERLSDEAIQRIRELRAEDPEKWSCNKLAALFGCKPYLVSKVAALPKKQRREKRKEVEREHEQERATWGDRKSVQREIRKKRRDFW